MTSTCGAYEFLAKPARAEYTVRKRTGLRPHSLTRKPTHDLEEQTIEGQRWETKEIIIGLDLTVTVPFLSTVPRRAGKAANYLIQQRLSMEAKSNWLPVGPTDFATLWKNRQVRYEQRAATVGGTWHLINLTVEMQRMTF